VESLVRQYADEQGLGVTEAIAQAVEIARQTERIERSENTCEAALKRYIEIANRGWKSTESWDREELHQRS